MDRKVESGLLYTGFFVSLSGKRAIGSDRRYRPKLRGRSGLHWPYQGHPPRRRTVPAKRFVQKVHTAQARAYIVDFEHISGDKAASSEFILSNAVLDHHLRPISGAFDGSGESLLVGASIKDRADFYFNLVRNMMPSLKCGLLECGMPYQLSECPGNLAANGQLP